MNTKYAVYYIVCIVLGYSLIFTEECYKVYFIFRGLNGSCINKYQMQVFWDDRFNDTNLLHCIIGYASPLEIFIHSTNFTIPCFIGLVWLFECLEFRKINNELATLKNEKHLTEVISEIRSRYLKLIHQVEDMSDTWGIMMAINLAFLVFVLCLAGFVSVKAYFVSKHMIIVQMVLYALSFSAFMIGPILLDDQVGTLFYVTYI